MNFFNFIYPLFTTILINFKQHMFNLKNILFSPMKIILKHISLNMAQINNSNTLILINYFPFIKMADNNVNNLFKINQYIFKVSNRFLIIYTNTITKFTNIGYGISNIYNYLIKIKNNHFSLNFAFKMNEYFIILFNKLLTRLAQIKKIKIFSPREHKIIDIASELNLLDQIFLNNEKNEDIIFGETAESSYEIAHMIKNILKNKYCEEIIKKGIPEKDRYKIIKKYLKDKFKN